jgi:cystathionine beta-lyase/cystathionine gamma-synthase
MKPSIYTKVAHDLHDSRHHGAVVFPIYQNTLFTFERHANPGHTYYYSRGDNPTVQELERRLALLEGGERARCFASGMAAISAAILSLVKQGDHVVCTDQAYGGARRILENYLTRFGVETTFVAADRLDQIAMAMRPNTVLLYLESPTSFLFDLQDIRACVELASKAGVKTIIDNTWATPCYQLPLSLGIDLVVYSLSKYVGGHSDAIGGAVIGSEALLQRIDEQEHAWIGGIMTPQTASLMLRGLRTLPLRMQRANETGRVIATYLQDKPFLRLRYPGLPSHPQYDVGSSQMSGYGSLMSFEIDVSRETMYNWADRLTHFRMGCSWGGYESLVIVLGHPAQFGSRNVNTNQESTLVRIYCGLEDPADLIADLEQSFAMAGWQL